MKTISTSETPALTFSPTQASQHHRAQSAKIGWIRAMSEKNGISFDITIKDSLGRVRSVRQNCKTDTNEYGELVNLPTMIGEDLEVEIENIKGTDKLIVFLN